MSAHEIVCESCKVHTATTNYRDKAGRIWRLCGDCWKAAKRRKA